PPLANEHLRLLRNTTLAAAIAYPDLMLVFAGTVLNQTVQAFEVMAITVATYLAISLAVSAAMNLYNRRVLRVGAHRPARLWRLSAARALARRSRARDNRRFSRRHDVAPCKAARGRGPGA